MSPHITEAGLGSQFLERAEDNYRHDAAPLLSWASWPLVSFWEKERYMSRDGHSGRGGCAGPAPLAPIPPQIHSPLSLVPWDPWK